MRLLLLSLLSSTAFAGSAPDFNFRSGFEEPRWIDVTGTSVWQ